MGDQLQRDLLRLLAKMREAGATLTEGHRAATAATERNPAFDFRPRLVAILSDLNALTETVATVTPPVEPHPHFRCTDAACPAHCEGGGL